MKRIQAIKKRGLERKGFLSLTSRKAIVIIP